MILTAWSMVLSVRLCASYYSFTRLPFALSKVTDVITSGLKVISRFNTASVRASTAYKLGLHVFSKCGATPNFS